MCLVLYVGSMVCGVLGTLLYHTPLPGNWSHSKLRSSCVRILFCTASNVDSAAADMVVRCRLSLLDQRYTRLHSTRAFRGTFRATGHGEESGGMQQRLLDQDAHRWRVSLLCGGYSIHCTAVLLYRRSRRSDQQNAVETPVEAMFGKQNDANRRHKTQSTGTEARTA